MTAFAILSGKALKSAIASYGKTASTFAERTHQLAYSALLHVENHHDAIYCNAIYTATPKNYRGAVVAWFKAFGKISFDAAKAEFTYSKGRKSDLPTALTVSPADYAKAKSDTADKAGKSLLERLESMMEGVLDSDKATDQDRAVASAVNKVLASFKRTMPKAEEPKSNVVPLAGKPEAKQEAPKAAKPKVAKADKAAKAAPKSDSSEGGMMTAREAAAEQRARLAAASQSVAA
jgi:hypothetical protein